MAQKLYKPLLIDSIKATVDLPCNRFVDFTGNICAEGAKAYGVCDVNTDAEQLAPVGVLGVLLVEAGGTITAGSTVTSDANGKAITSATSQSINGYALDDATEGEIFRIIRGI
ncbi:MAG: DUF2190 family protein [Cyanobacteria bacterium SIG32]|nr:DUF2190 family protein [Cyanobacteria bacterium SIG32]